jgi:hypothetical protein
MLLSGPAALTQAHLTTYTRSLSAGDPRPPPQYFRRLLRMYDLRQLLTPQQLVWAF